MPNFEFNFNRTFKEVFTTDKRVIDIWGGRGRGGSHFGTDDFLFLITQPQYFRGYFIRQSFNDIRGSLFQDFKDRLAENPTLNPDDFHIRENEISIIYKPTGNAIFSKGVRKDGQSTAKLKSLAGATHVLIEEADELAEDDFDQLDLSLRTKKAAKIQVIRIFNPPGRKHWIWRDYNLIDAPLVDENGKDVDGWFMAVVKSDADILSIHSTYEDNKKNVAASTIDRFERFKSTNPDYYYNIVKGYIPEGMKGRVYKGWQIVSIDDFNALQYPTKYALDFGFSNDPAALIEVKRHNQNVWANELIYETQLTNRDICLKMYQMGVPQNSTIVADNAEVKSIAEFRRGWDFENKVLGIDKDGFTKVAYPQMIPAQKGHGSVAAGITRVKEMTVHFTEQSANAWNEYSKYRWALDKEKNPTNTPVDADNHIMDGLRYVLNTQVF